MSFVWVICCVSGAQAEKYMGPVVDAHVHIRSANFSIAKYEMEASSIGIKKTILMPTPGDQWDFPGKSVSVFYLCDGAFAGALSKNQFDLADSYVAHSIDRFNAGECIGFGEIGLRHYNKTLKAKGGPQQPTIVAPLESKAVNRLFEFSNQKRAPVVLHIEPSFIYEKINTLVDVKKFYFDICLRYPTSIIIASHTGMMSPIDLGEVFDACPNVYSDFKFIKGAFSLARFVDLYPINDSEKIKDEWVDFFNKYPDRLMYGSDAKPGYSGYDQDIKTRMEHDRNLMGVFPDKIQSMLMYENALRIFNINDSAAN